jgi:hypothetical protein
VGGSFRFTDSWPAASFGFRLWCGWPTRAFDCPSPIGFIPPADIDRPDAHRVRQATDPARGPQRAQLAQILDTLEPLVLLAWICRPQLDVDAARALLRAEPDLLRIAAPPLFFAVARGRHATLIKLLLKGGAQVRRIVRRRVARRVCLRARAIARRASATRGGSRRSYEGSRPEHLFEIPDYEDLVAQCSKPGLVTVAGEPGDDLAPGIPNPQSNPESRIPSSRCFDS